MAEKFLEHDGSGALKENEALTSSAGAGDSGKIIGLDVGGRVDLTMMPVGYGPEIMSIASSENLSAGDWVNVWSDTTAKVRKADATVTGKECNGFVLSAATAPAAVLVYFEGINNQVSGLTPGVTQFLSTSAGGSTESAPSSSGNIVQKLGKSLSATEAHFEGSNPIELI